jgi:putative transposase
VSAVRLQRGDVQALEVEYEGMHVEEAKRLEALEDENRRLKHVVAELSLEKRALEGALGKWW